MADYSPMMKQYFEVKEKYPNTLLFFRLGDFYEMFFNDAKIASRELELTLTGRDCGQEERAPMCGVPFHSAETYIARLVAKGYKVAICEQMEDPALAKGIVKRSVIRVITPGTVMESSMLDEAKNNYIASAYYQGDKVGICFADISTGELEATTLLREACPEILKGNDAEIRAIAGAHFESRGIDVLQTNTAETIEIAKMLASTLRCVVLVTGKTDIITNGETTVLCENGTPRLSLVTGTGCMVHALCASYSAVTDPFTAAVLAVSTMGICGELAERKSEGLGSFRIALLDVLSLLSDDDYTRLLKLREV